MVTRLKLERRVFLCLVVKKLECGSILFLCASATDVDAYSSLARAVYARADIYLLGKPLQIENGDHR